MSDGKIIGERIESVDALRGWAAIFVVMYHMASMPKPSLATPHWAEVFILSGYTGVTLFYLISAFTLSYMWHARKSESRVVIKFYIRRFFRIAPLFYIWLIIALLRDVYFKGLYHSPETILLNILFIFNFFPGQEAGVVWASWTLGVEMMFYLIFPIIITRVSDWQRAVCFLLITLLIAQLWSAVQILIPIPDALRSEFLKIVIVRHLPTFAMGVLAYYIYDRFVKSKELHPVFSINIILFALFGYGALIGGKLNVLFESLYWGGVFYCFLLCATLITPFRVLVNRVSLLWGEISYSLYLNHPTLLVILVPVYHTIYDMNLPVTVKFLSSFLVSLVALTVVSYITYRLVERPGMAIGRKVIKRLK